MNQAEQYTPPTEAYTPLGPEGPLGPETTTPNFLALVRDIEFPEDMLSPNFTQIDPGDGLGPIDVQRRAIKVEVGDNHEQYATKNVQKEMGYVGIQSFVNNTQREVKSTPSTERFNAISRDLYGHHPNKGFLTFVDAPEEVIINATGEWSHIGFVESLAEGNVIVSPLGYSERVHDMLAHGAGKYAVDAESSQDLKAAAQLIMAIENKDEREAAARKLSIAYDNITETDLFLLVSEETSNDVLTETQAAQVVGNMTREYIPLYELLHKPSNEAEAARVEKLAEAAAVRTINQLLFIDEVSMSRPQAA